MTKKAIAIIGASLTAMIIGSYSYMNYSTLEKNLHHNFPDSKIAIYHRDDEKKIILFSEGTEIDKQYVLSKFDKKIGCFYDVNGKGNKGGIRIKSPFFVTVSNRNSVGNIIWGVLNTQESIAKVDIKFFNDDNHSFIFNPSIKDNVFIYYPSDSYETLDFFHGSHWYYDIRAYDDNGNVIIDEKKSNVPGVL